MEKLMKALQAKSYKEAGQLHEKGNVNEHILSNVVASTVVEEFEMDFKAMRDVHTKTRTKGWQNNRETVVKLFEGVAKYAKSLCKEADKDIEGINKDIEEVEKVAGELEKESRDKITEFSKKGIQGNLKKEAMETLAVAKTKRMEVKDLRDLIEEIKRKVKVSGMILGMLQFHKERLVVAMTNEELTKAVLELKKEIAKLKKG